MKRIAVFLLVLLFVMAFMLVGCGGDDNGNPCADACDSPLHADGADECHCHNHCDTDDCGCHGSH